MHVAFCFRVCVRRLFIFRVGIGGTRFISFEGRHWHNDCFTCSSCKTSMVGKGFITDAEDILCPDCAKKRLMADAVEQ